jgi:hypothetical protein
VIKGHYLSIVFLITPRAIIVTFIRALYLLELLVQGAESKNSCHKKDIDIHDREIVTIKVYTFRKGGILMNEKLIETMACINDEAVADPC